MNISEWKQALRDHSQLWCHNCPNPKGQSWPKGSAHNFEWKGDVSGKSILETHHLCGLCLEVRTTWKQPKLRRSPAWVLHQSAPKVARGFGSGKHSHLTPTWLPERGLIFSPNSPYLLLQTSCSFFSTTITCCLLQGMLKLYVFLLYSSFVFPSFICSFLYPFILIVGPLKNEACSLNFWNNSCLGDGDYGQLLKIMEHLCQKNVSCFFYLSRKGFITRWSRRASQPPVHSLVVQASSKMHTARSPSTGSTFPAMGSTAPQALRPGQGKLTSKVVQGMIHKPVGTILGKK